jgi:acetyl/propionyl-CoA carboxylase alpha subunit
LDQYVVTGLTTNIPYLRSILRHPAFAAGVYDTGLLEREHTALLATASEGPPLPAVMAAFLVAHQRDRQHTGASRRLDGVGALSPWRQVSRRRRPRL